MSELVNRTVLLYVVAIVSGLAVGSVYNQPWMPLLFGMVATCALVPTFIKMSNKAAVHHTEGLANTKGLANTEGFANDISDMNDIGVEGSELTTLTQTTKSARNPFQNIMVDDYKYAPNRDSAPDITTTESKVALDAMFRTQWYSDPTDVFGKTQGQRMFLTQPNTTIPNDQKSYQEWLYKIPGKSCKEGNYDACYGGTNGSVIPWLNT
jgi:hypothetical protein